MLKRRILFDRYLFKKMCGPIFQKIVINSILIFIFLNLFQICFKFTCQKMREKEFLKPHFHNQEISKGD